MLKLSFLISLYNGEKYLERCLDSILQQDVSFEVYEIVCVDDCSSDGTIKIIKKYQEKYPNIRLYNNEKNCRLAANVNKLMDLALAPYLWYIDQDDYIETNCLDRILSLLEPNKLDTLLFNYRLVDEQENLIKDTKVFSDSDIYSGIEFVNSQFSDRDYCYYILGYKWRAIYKKSFWEKNDIRSVNGMNYDDTIIVPKSIILSRRIMSISDVLYNYRQNSTSMTSVKSFVKKGNYIYEFAFMVGDETEQFYKQLCAIESNLAYNLANNLKWRYNNFILDLVRTSTQQKRVFYKLLRDNKSFVDTKKSWLNWKSRFLISPLGYPLTLLLGLLYKIKKAF